MQALAKPGDFRQLFRSGRKYQSSHLEFFYLSIPKDELKLAVAIKKKFGTAVVRNRIRRRIKEFLRQKKFLTGTLLIIQKSNLSAAQARKQLIQELHKALEILVR